MKLPQHPALAVAVLALVAWSAAAVAGDDSTLLLQHELRSLNGDSSLRLRDFEGRIVVVNFWASWCKPCQRELPELDRMASELPGDQVVFAAISVDQKQRMAQRFAKNAGLSLPLYHDGADGLARSLDLPALPCTYVFDARGQLALMSRGNGPEDIVRLRSAIDSLRGGASVQSVEAR